MIKRIRKLVQISRLRMITTKQVHELVRTTMVLPNHFNVTSGVMTSQHDLFYQHEGKAHPGGRDLDLGEELDEELCDTSPGKDAVRSIQHNDNVHVLLTI